MLFKNFILNKGINIIFIWAGLVVSIFYTSCSPGKVLPSAGNSEIAGAINTDKWIFTVDQVRPQSGRSRAANGHYDVVFKRDTVTVYLPYFGRSYGTAGILNNNPLDFKTTNFIFNKEEGKRGAWLVTIHPKDNNEVQSLAFTLYDKGSAQLDVLMTNRSPISFSGSLHVQK